MDIQKFDLPPGTLIRICEEAAAQFQHGWRLIAIVPWKGRVQHQEEQRDERGNYLRSNNVWRDAEDVRYVLAQDESDTVNAARREMFSAQSDLAVEKSDRAAAVAALAEEKEISAKAVADFEKANHFLIGKARALQIAEDAKQKMESDISKLRDALGELRMKEILGSK